MEIVSPLDIDHVEMFCPDHGAQVTTGEVDGMVLYYSCPITGCTQDEDYMDMEVCS